MNITIHIDALDLFIFLGICLGFILSFFFIFKSKSNIEANRFQGLLLLSLSLGILEQLLNLTGYIVKVLPVTNFSEPLNFVYSPLLYLYVKRSIDQSEQKKDWLHFIVFFLYLGYSCFYFFQPNDIKYNSYIDSYHPDWPLLTAYSKIPEDPLGIRKHLDELTLIQFIVYIPLALVLLIKRIRLSGKSFFTSDDEILKSLRGMIIHFIIVIVIFTIVRNFFEGDLGDYFIGIYVSVIILITTVNIMDDSAYFDRSASFMDIPIGKYRKSSLNESAKDVILDNIIKELETNHFFSNNLASLSYLAKRIGESPHHVSQVINERTSKNFFELLAWYRIEEAKRIISDDTKGQLTIEEISEMVGYNSKTAFNNAFKRLMGNTPSEYRKSINL